MSTILNRLYGRGPDSLLSIPIDINDNPTAVTFVDLTGKIIKDDGDTEAGDLADRKANFGAAGDPRKNVQLFKELTPKPKLPSGQIGTKTPNLPPNVVMADVNPAPDGGWTVRGFDAGGARATSALTEIANVSFTACASDEDRKSRLRTESAFLAYYLPWKKNHSRVLKLGQDADFFFTSSLTGCTVQAYGNPMAPTVTHTNAGGIADETESQAYMGDLLALYAGTEGSWDQGLDNQSTFTRKEYKSIAERHIDRKLDALGARPEVELSGPPSTKTVVVGFRDPHTGYWSFHFQTWLKIHYAWHEQVGRGFVRKDKKVIRIKRVGEIWPTPRVIANAWKEADLTPV